MYAIRSYYVLLFINVYATNNLIVVAQDGSGDFNKIQDALNSIPTETSDTFIIYIKNGIYNEKIFLET